MKNTMFSRKNKIHNPFKRRHTSKTAAEPMSPMDFDFEFSTTFTPTAFSSRRSSIYCSSPMATSPRINTYPSFSPFNYSSMPTCQHHPFNHYHNCQGHSGRKHGKQQKGEKGEQQQYNPRRSITGFVLWWRLTWVKVERTFR